jgi:hypothetical protein
MDLSIIIAHRDVNEFPCIDCKTGKAVNASAAAPLGLWVTIHSIMEDLENSGLSYEFCILTNGSEKPHSDTQNVLHWLDLTKHLTWVEHSVEPVSPPHARQRCTEHATGKYLFFFDNHVMVKPGYFKRALQSMEKYRMDMLHSTTRFFFGEKDCYHYKLKLNQNFWAESDFDAKSEEPYRCAMGGHGGFIVRRDVWEEVGGYGWENFKGYGGEESYFDLKMWLLGKENWIDPKLLHYHFAGSRGYKRHYTDEFFINMMGVANIIGGQDWMYKVQDSFTQNYMKMKTGKSIFDLMIEAEALSSEHAAWLASRRKLTLDELLDKFKADGIAH